MSRAGAARRGATATGELSSSLRAPGASRPGRGRLVDLLVALAVFLYNLPILPVYVTGGSRLVAGYAISVFLCAPYVFRRRYPLAVFGITMAAASAQLLLGTGLIPADIILLPVVYTVATRFRWPVSVTATVIVIVWFLIAEVPRFEDDYLDIGDLVAIVALIALAATWGTLVRTRRNYIASLEERARRLEREREVHAQIAVAEERAKIAREIHDIVSHSLSVVVIMSDGAASKIDTEPERAKAAMYTVRDTGRGALAEMRRMLGVLRDDEPGSHAPQPGIAQLPQLVEESRSAGLPVTLTVEGEPVPVSSGLDLTTYRVVQEALTNARRHAGPSLQEVDVRVRYTGTDLEIRVVDDGRGFRDEPDPESSGHGLIGMRERVTAYGGTLQHGMRAGGGFEVFAVLPIGTSS